MPLLILGVSKEISAHLSSSLPLLGLEDAPGDCKPDAPFNLLVGHSFQERRRNFPPYFTQPHFPSAHLSKGPG